MIRPLPRGLRLVLISVSTAALVAAGPAPKQAPKAAAAPAAKPAPYSGPWLYRDSDIPVDPAWTFGELPNGVRYAVRRGQVPPNQISIRVAVDAGSLMEREEERGFAHYLEHLSFRGSRHVPDGEAKRVWQRFGATFGSDSNAATTPTQTIFRLDLPNGRGGAIDESLKILSGMIAAPSLTDTAIDAERRTVLAESREQVGPAQRVQDATRELFFNGQLLASRSPIGTTTALNAATPEKVKAFHQRWYRPERLIVSISGDGDPAEFEKLIKKHFSDWTVPGSAPLDPDFGKPNPAAPTALIVTEPGMPNVISLATLRPWVRKNDTIAYNQGKLVDLVAIQLINRRLETRARAGGSFLQAEVSRDDVSRSADGTFVSIVPIDNDWKAALADVRAVIEDARTKPAPQDEIDREISEFTAALDVGVESQRAEASSKQADDIIEAVNIRETVATAEVAREVFGAMKDKLGPNDIMEATRRLFTGVGPRALLSSPTAMTDGQTQIAAALAAPVTTNGATTGQAQIGFDKLPKLPGTSSVVSDTTEFDLRVRTLRLSNGVRVMLLPNPGEAGRIYVSARFGTGLQSMPRNVVTPAWAAGAALVQGGIGDLGQEAIDRMTSGRRIGMGFDTADDAFVLRSVTRPADLKDQLMLMATKLYAPRWDEAPVKRARAAAKLGLDTAEVTPQAVLGRTLNEMLHGGDKRWAAANRAEVDALTPEAFRAFWEPRLAQGDIELSVFGDFQTSDALAAIFQSFGALPARTPAKVMAGSDTSLGPKPNKAPQRLTYKGPPDQAAAILAWGIGGGMDKVFESRALDVLAALFSDRLFERFREGEGGSYSPNVSSNWPAGMKGGGNFIVAAQLKPEMIDRFVGLSREIAADFAAKPVSADELERSLGPMRQLYARASTGNGFWLSQLSGATSDKRKFAAVRSLPEDLLKITPAVLQKVAKRYLKQGKVFTLLVLPETAAAPTPKP